MGKKIKNLFSSVLLMTLSFPVVCFAYSAYNTRQQTQTFDFNALVVVPLKSTLIEIVGFLPNLLVAVLILLLGWIVAKIAQWVITRFLKSIRFDNFAKKIGINSLLEENKETPILPHKWFGLLAFWVSIIISFIMSLNQLRLRIASAQLDHFFNFLLTIFTVVVIFVLGMFLSFITAKIVKSVAENTKVQKPQLWANLTRWAILSFTVIVCAIEIGLPPQIMLITLAIAYLTICITFMISFGIGGATWAGRILDRTLDKKKQD